MLEKNKTEYGGIKVGAAGSAGDGKNGKESCNFWTVGPEAALDKTPRMGNKHIQPLNFHVGKHPLQ